MKVAYSTITTKDGLAVESELTGSTLRVFSKDKKPMFVVSLTHAGNRVARLYNGSGEYTFKVRTAIRNYLKSQGFLRFTFERGNPSEGLRPLVGKL